MAKRDYYEVLGINKNSSSDEIKKAYRTLAKKYHPDVNKEADAESKFKEINEAYEVLSDPDKKSRYDQFGHQGVDQGAGFGGAGGFGDFGFDFGGVDIGDIFGSFFGGGSSSRRANNGPRKGKTLQSRIRVSFIDSVLGKTIEQNLTKHEICSHCNGSGAETKSDLITCNECNGHGRVVLQRRTPFGIVNSEDICSHCGGSGKIIKTKCKTCRGQRYITKDIKTKITIPAGIRNEQEVIVEGFGGPGINGGPSGDLSIIVFVDSHKYFVREQNNIHLDLLVSFYDIVNESVISVPTPYGLEKISLSNDIKSGDTLTLREKGFKIIGTKKYGDLKLHVKIYVPKLSKKEREKIVEALKDNKDDQATSWTKKVMENK